MNKEKILNSIKNDLNKIIEKKLEENKYEYFNFFSTYINEYNFVIKSFFDIQNKNILLDGRKFFILRERWGINGENISKTLEVVGNELGLSRERIRQIEEKTKEEVLDMIIKIKRLNLFELNFSLETINFILSNEKIQEYSDLHKYLFCEETSKEIYEIKSKLLKHLEKIGKSIKDVNIKALDIDDIMYYHLSSLNIITIRDLLNLTQEEFLEIKNISKRKLNYIINKIKGLGYEFKKDSELIIDFAQMVNLNYNIVNKLKKYDIKTIKDLIAMKKNDLKTKLYLDDTECQELINKLNSIGIFVFNVNLNIEPEITIEDFVKLFNLSNRAYLCLRRNGFVTIKDIISLEKSELYNIKYLGEILYNEIVDKIHLSGFKFADELIDNKLLEEDIREDILKENSMNDDIIVNLISNKLKDIEKLIKEYKSLSLEKEELLDKEKELDFKLKEIMNKIKDLYRENYYERRKK